MIRKSTSIIYVALILLWCNVTVQAQQVNFNWAKGFGGLEMDMGQGITVDAAGYVYTTGSYQGPADFGSGTLITPSVFGTADIFVTKQDAAGNLIWLKTMGGAGLDRGLKIAVDDSGNVYTAGFFESPDADFNPGADTFIVRRRGGGDADPFVLKLNKDGEFVWVRHILGDADLYQNQDMARDIVIDKDNNILVSGFFSKSATFGSITLTAVNNASDAFVTKLTPGGQFLWAKNFGGTSTWQNRVEGIDVDTSGNIYITGAFGSTVKFDTITLVSFNSSTDAFVAKLNPSGNFIWAKKLGGNSSEWGYSIDVDIDGNVYTSGSFSATADFNPGPDSFKLTTNNTGNDIYVSKLDKDGNFVWANRMGGRRSEGGGWGIAVDVKGNAVITGSIRDTFITHGTAQDTFRNLATVGDYDILIAKLDASGKFIWAGNIGSPGPSAGNDEMGYSIALDASGNMYTTGVFSGANVDFDPGPDTFRLSAYNNYWDIFIMKLGCVADSALTIDAKTRCSDTTINGVAYTASGTYTQVYHGIYGCDSIITIHFDLQQILEQKPIITVNGFELSTTQSYSSYQWLLNGTVIAGATSGTYTVSENGAYRVFASNEKGCSDTSEIYTVTNVGLDNMSGIGRQIDIYPNPAVHTIYVNSPVSVNMIITGIDGKQIKSTEQSSMVSVMDLAQGVYFLRILDKEGHLLKVEKIVKQ